MLVIYQPATIAQALPPSTGLQHTPPERLEIRKPSFRLQEMRRVGAVCRDGTRSSGTAGGTCSGHGGVKYWIYTQVEVFEAYQSNLPAIPPQELLPLTPEVVRDLVRIQPMPLPDWSIGEEEQSPPPPKRDKSRRKKNKDRKNKAEDNTDDETEGADRTRRVPHALSDTAARWQVLDILMPFVLLAALGFLFVTVYHIFRRLL